MSFAFTFSESLLSFVLPSSSRSSSKIDLDTDKVQTAAVDSDSVMLQYDRAYKDCRSFCHT